MRRLSPDALILLALIALMGVLSFAIARQTAKSGDASGESKPHRSVSSTQPGGLRGLFLLLQAHGLHPQSYNRSPGGWPTDSPIMVTAEEYINLNSGIEGVWKADEVKTALRWVDKGGTLLILTGEENALTEELDLSITETDAAKAKSPLSPLQPLPFLRGVKNIDAGKNRWDDSPSSVLPLFGDLAPFVVVTTRGKGRIIAVASAALADNKHLAKADNARFLVQTIAAYAGQSGRVLFDEYHQGYADDDSLWRVLGRPGQMVVWQILAVVALIAYSGSRRFGLPRPLPAASRVSSEYVSSLAGLYQRANARDAALEGIYQPFWRDLCRIAAAPENTPPAEIVRRVTVYEGGAGEGLTGRLGALLSLVEEQRAAGDKIGEGELIDIVRRIEAMRKELRLGRTA